MPCCGFSWFSTKPPNESIRDDIVRLPAPVVIPVAMSETKVVDVPVAMHPVPPNVITNQFGVKNHDDTDIVIAVMGATGVGKTTFIASLTSSCDEPAQGYDALDSGTKQIKTYRISLPFEDQQLNFVLVDTPGFDDPTRPNSEVLEHISDWLAHTYREGRLLNGLVYLHRITDIRFDAGASSTLNIFRKIYGGKGYEKLALVTSMWNDVQPTRVHEMETRETELKTIHWGAFIHRHDSALIARFDYATPQLAEESAMKIVSALLKQSISSPDLRLLLQQELVDQNKSLPMTEAGKAAFTLVETAKYYLKQIAPLP